MTSNTFPVAADTAVVCAKYKHADPTETKPFVLDISIAPESEVEYREVIQYPSPENRDCAYLDFDQAKADRFYQRAVRLVNM